MIPDGHPPPERQPDAIRAALAAEIVRLRDEAAATAAAHARRVDDLLDANNRYLERARRAEREVARLRILGADQATRIVALTSAAHRHDGPAPPYPPLARRPEGEWR